MLVFAACFTEEGHGQSTTFSSGSTGADGALNITAPGVTYFNPTALGLNPAIPNIFNFTTINIASGSILKFTEEVFHGPVYFLASGNVTIAGGMDLTGDNGPDATNLQSSRLPSYGGSGGYGGGLGSANGTSAQPGGGPGGGGAATSGKISDGGNGSFTGNQYLTPLIGGSGGGGSFCSGGIGSTAGAGGGAILIASSTSITIASSGSISVNGGSGAAPTGCNQGGGQTVGSGGGAGGGIRLIANSVAGSGNLFAAGGGNRHNSSAATNGLVRLEAFQNTFTGGGCSCVVRSTPYSLALPTSAPAALMVTSINGVPINANPFSFPDVTLNSSTSVTVNIQAQFIPLGTVPTLIVSSETGPDQSIQATPLTGSLQSSTSTATITFPTGGSRGFVKATWTQ